VVTLAAAGDPSRAPRLRSGCAISCAARMDLGEPAVRPAVALAMPGLAGGEYILDAIARDRNGNSLGWGASC